MHIGYNVSKENNYSRGAMIKLLGVEEIMFSYSFKHKCSVSIR